MTFGEVEQNFEGEADPDVMTLEMKAWRWIKTAHNNDTEITPNDPQDFIITFKDDGSFSVKTDCNSMTGNYAVNGKQIEFGDNIAMTKMFCEDSKEQDFASLFREIKYLFFTSKGELIFDLKFDSGSANFKYFQF